MKFQVRFDGPPGHMPGRFVETEDEHGRSFCAGEWKQDGEFWLLVIDTDDLHGFEVTPEPREQFDDEPEVRLGPGF